MPHVTFIHGISQMPAEEALTRMWREALARGEDRLSLSDEGVTWSMIYWSDLMYGAPTADVDAFESALENSPQAIDAGGDAELPEPQTAEEAAFLAAMQAKLATLSADEMDDAPEVVEGSDLPLERIPLPWFIKRRFMKTFLRDVHHYLFNTTHAPPGGNPVPIQDTIRKRVVDALAAVETDGPHVMIAHSMGTVIAYDCLKRVPECPAIDGLITIGTPLGIDEVQDKLQPGWSREDGFPHAKCPDWVNIYDSLDVVCALDPKLANDYRRGGQAVIPDISVSNEGAWRHSATKYLKRQQLGTELRRLLGF